MNALLNRLIKAIGLLKTKDLAKYLFKSQVFSLSSVKLVEGISTYTSDFRTVIDIGANSGQFLFAAAIRFPHATIHSFEPIPALFDKLKAKTNKKDNVIVNNLALSDLDGTISFFESEYSHISSALKINGQNNNPKYKESKVKQIEVKCTTLNTYLSTVDFEGPTLLKIDAQGLEKTILEGSRQVLKNIDYIVLELAFEKLYDNQPTFEEIHEYLLQIGFKLVAPLDFHTGTNNKIIEMDALYKKSNDE